jgi:hypothetical protein
VTRVVLAVLAAAALFGCAASNPSALNPSDGMPRDAIVYIIGRGWHTDIGLPIEEIAAPLNALTESFPGVRFLTFGFGDRTYLLDRDTTMFTMLAALLPGRGALLVTALRATPGAAFGEPNVVPLHISQLDLVRLQQRLWLEFQPSSDEAPVMIADGPYPGSLFYVASAPYSGLYTCNTWTAAMMRAAGLPMPIGGVLFASQVMGMARWIATQQK